MYSLEHIKYIKKIKKEKRIISILQISIFIFFIMIWQILADKGIINTFIFSSPKKVLNIIIDLYRNNQLFSNIMITIYETLFSFIVASLLGILIASIMWWNKNLYKVFEPYLTILNSLPKVALGPIIIIWFGASMKSIIVMALLISLIITIINIYDGFSSTNQNKLRLMYSLHATKFQILVFL